MAIVTNSNVISSSAQIIDNIIVNADVASDAAIAGSKIQELSLGVNAGVVPSTGIVNAHIAAGAAIALSKLAAGTQGGLPFFGASGAPSELAAGTSGQFLKTQGAGANPIWDTINNDWQQLGETTLTGGATSISVSSFAARKDLRIVFRSPGMSGTGISQLTFNSDGSALYGTRGHIDGGAAAAINAATSIDLSQNTNNTASAQFMDMVVDNHAAGVKKFGWYNWHKLSTTAASGPIIMTSAGFVYASTAAAITSVTITLSTNEFDIGTRLTVYGKKD